MGCIHGEWIEPIFLNKLVKFPGGTAWRLSELLAENCYYYNEDEHAEAAAVFTCRQDSGPQKDREAIMRVRMQIPRSVMLNPDPKFQGKEASKTYSTSTGAEITALKRLTEGKCLYTPRFLGMQQRRQNSKMWVPGGWLVFILMEKVPGVVPWNFWSPDGDRAAMTREQRDNVRAAFKKALSAIFEHRFSPCDPKLDNISWDEDSQKCYIVDLEEFIDWQDSPHLLQFRDSQYILWGLAERLPDRSVAY